MPESLVKKESLKIGAVGQRTNERWLKGPKAPTKYKAPLREILVVFFYL